MNKIRSISERIFAAIAIPTVRGPNRGIRLGLPVCGRHWHGSWEPERVSLLERLIHPGDVVWDVGAHHGITALMAARSVGDTGTEHAFEPSSRNFDFLTRHVAWNKADNVMAHNLAIAAQSGES